MMLRTAGHWGQPWLRSCSCPCSSWQQPSISGHCQHMQHASSAACVVLMRLPPPCLPLPASALPASRHHAVQGSAAACSTPSRLAAAAPAARFHHPDVRCDVAPAHAPPTCVQCLIHTPSILGGMVHGWGPALCSQRCTPLQVMPQWPASTGVSSRATSRARGRKARASILLYDHTESLLKYCVIPQSTLVVWTLRQSSGPIVKHRSPAT